MIQLIESGKYKLIETKGQSKILTLEARSYVWMHAAGIGELLISTHKTHRMDYILAMGNYRIYEVRSEPNLTDLIHLELFVGDGLWQGYLLLTGLPDRTKVRSRIVPTDELVTKSLD